MEFLLGHWHCVVPALAIAIVLILRNRAGNRAADGGEYRHQKDFSTGGKR
jgi:hypothetical protein